MREIKKKALTLKKKQELLQNDPPKITSTNQVSSNDNSQFSKNSSKEKELFKLIYYILYKIKLRTFQHRLFYFSYIFNFKYKFKLIYFNFKLF